jgi:hypothetical protein
MPIHQDRGDHVGDREVVPLVPDEVADAGAADEHLGRHDHQPGDADRYAHAGEDGRRRRRRDDGEARRNVPTSSVRATLSHSLRTAATPNAVLISIGQSEQMKIREIDRVPDP